MRLQMPNYTPVQEGQAKASESGPTFLTREESEAEILDIDQVMSQEASNGGIDKERWIHHEIPILIQLQEENSTLKNDVALLQATVLQLDARIKALEPKP